jgi:hypothetical protein
MGNKIAKWLRNNAMFLRGNKNQCSIIVTPMTLESRQKLAVDHRTSTTLAGSLSF